MPVNTRDSATAAARPCQRRGEGLVGVRGDDGEGHGRCAVGPEGKLDEPLCGVRRCTGTSFRSGRVRKLSRLAA